MNWIYAVNATRLLIIIIKFSPDFSKAILHKDFRMRFFAILISFLFHRNIILSLQNRKIFLKILQNFFPALFLPAAPCYNAGGKPLPAFPNILSGGFL